MGNVWIISFSGSANKMTQSESATLHQPVVVKQLLVGADVTVGVDSHTPVSVYHDQPHLAVWLRAVVGEAELVAPEDC